MEWLFLPETWIALVTLTVLEIVLGIDNIIFVSILTGKLPPHQQARGRTIGLGGAMITRVLLLLSLAAIMRLTVPWFQVIGFDVSGRDIILLVGGLFLIAKSTFEIHEKLEGPEEQQSARKTRPFWGTILQIMVLDIVFSLDSVITAIGMANQVAIMIGAIVIAVIVMMFASGSVSAFVHKHPTITMLALSFLLLIGVTLVAEGLHQHIAKGYIYFAMAFSVFVEMLNIRVRKAHAKQHALHTSGETER
jgi:predicted tellurium resistance membrane protein TerC